MKILFCSLGKAHDDYVKQGIADFSARINKYFKTEWKIIPPPKNAASLNENELKKQEAKQIVEFVNAEDFLVLLDERGRQFSSPELAKFLQQRANEGKRLIFLIGGAFGVNEIIMKRANFIWSLSALVFPHMLARLILSEQVYRACTILKNEKYHHGNVDLE